MKKILLLLFLLSSALFANIGKITAVKGDVEIERETQKILAKVGDILESKDKLLTGDNSKVLLMFTDKTVITIGKNSEFEVESYLFDEANPPKNEASFKFAKGIFRTITGGIGKLNKEKFKIKTKSASIGIRGTIFLVEVRPEQNLLNIGVEDGGVFMTPDAQDITPQDIGKGQALTYNDQTKEFKVVPIEEVQSLKVIKAESKELEDEAVASGQMKKEDDKQEEDTVADDQKEEDEKKKEEDGDAPAKDGEKKDDGEADDTVKNDNQDENKEDGNSDTTTQDDNDQGNDDTTPNNDGENTDNTPANTENEQQPNTDTTAPADNTLQTDLDDGLGDTDLAALENDTETFDPNLNTPNNDTSNNNPDNNTENTGTGDTPQTNVNANPTDNINDVTNNVNDTIEQTKETTDDVVNETTNTVPTLSIENINLDEDNIATIIFEANDLDGDTLSYSKTNPSNGTAIFSGSQIIYQPNSNFNGIDSLTLTVDDRKGGTITKTVSITVNPVNDTPEITVANSTLDEDTQATLNFSATDIDGDNLTYTINDPKNGEATLNGTTIIYTPENDYFGSDTITLTADDGKGGVKTETITFIVNNINDLPQVTKIENTTLDEDTSLTININGVSDIDGDALTYSISSPSNGTATLSGTTITYIPNQNFAGTDSITLTIDDGNGGIVTETINLTVNNLTENLTDDITTITNEIEEITGDLLPQDNLANLDYGFVVPSGETNTLNAYDTYIRGTLTPEDVIANYITNQATASYSGGVSALVNGTATDGTIDLTIQFGEQNPISGSLNITEGNWQGAINSGTVTPQGFNSNDITGSSNFGSITNGDLDGKFYGVDGSNIGGTIKLNTTSTSVKGIFGASTDTIK